MKKNLLLLALAALLLISADPRGEAALTIVNKSGLPIALSMQGIEEEEIYYLSVVEGSIEAPSEKTYFVVKDIYMAQVLYIETWDPVYGFQCAGAAPIQLNAMRNTKVIIFPCSTVPPNRGEEPHILKYFPWPRGLGRLFGFPPIPPAPSATPPPAPIRGGQ
jgi:hypothetical protein